MPSGKAQQIQWYASLADIPDLPACGMNACRSMMEARATTMAEPIGQNQLESC